jgi:transcriptional regulator with XRE-family HTH domain
MIFQQKANSDSFIAFGCLRRIEKVRIIINVGGTDIVKGRRKSKETITGVNIRATFSRNLKRLRVNMNLSQVSLAGNADLAPNFINDIENGKKWVSPETIGKLARALNAEPYMFFLSDARNDKEAELFSLYLNDFEDSMKRSLDEYRGRFIGGSPKDRDKAAEK